MSRRLQPLTTQGLQVAVSFIFLASVALLELHGPDGQAVLINPAQVNSLRAPTAVDLHRYFPKNTACVVLTTDGKFIAVTENCQTIRDRLSR